MACYRIDPSRSRFTVQAFATGPLAFFGHSPTFAVRDFEGVLRFEGGKIEGLVLELTVLADSLQLEDRVSDADRREIEGRMRRDVLETIAFPEIAFQTVAVSADPISPGRYQLHMNGRLSLHGVTRSHPVDAELLVFEDGLRVRGGCPLRMPDYQIRPVTALGGAIKLKNEVRVSFDIAGLPEAEGS